MISRRAVLASAPLMRSCSPELVVSSRVSSVPDVHLRVSWQGQEPVYPNTIRRAFRDHLLPPVALTIPPGTSRPCVHGLRHSFFVRSLLRWYREGLDPAARLNDPSTFLEQLNPHSTAVYLTITSELFAAANGRFEMYATPLCREAQP